ncbi:hypothetical protein ABPG75_013670 [Micractinium tetrahymenae]
MCPPSSLLRRCTASPSCGSPRAGRCLARRGSCSSPPCSALHTWRWQTTAGCLGSTRRWRCQPPPTSAPCVRTSMPAIAAVECTECVCCRLGEKRGTAGWVGNALLQGASSPEGAGALGLQELAAAQGFVAAAGTAVLCSLLELLLPGGLPGCCPASLDLEMDCAYLAPLHPLAHQRCPLLEHLTHLRLRCCPGAPGDDEIAADMQAFLAVVLPRTRRLRRLSLDVQGQQVPECMLALPALHSLALSGPALQLMPAGPLLQGLEELILGSYMPCLPRALRGARLRRLVLTNSCISLDRADVDEVLLRLPELRELSLPANLEPPQAQGGVQDCAAAAGARCRRAGRGRWRRGGGGGRAAGVRWPGS